MMHTYPKQIHPTVEVARCDKPVRFAYVFRADTVSTFCAEGHHIKSKIYSGNPDQAMAVARRLNRWVRKFNKE